MMFQGACAIICAYLIFWPMVYFVARRYFGFSREWAAPLASGISICGVSAAIATGGAIRARPIVPVMVSSLVVIFSVVELLILPFAAQHFLYHQPLVAGAWMALAVKTDGAAVASGAIADALIRAKASGTGMNFQPGWVMSTAATVKVFIDIMIGVWAFVLAWVWSAKFDRKEGTACKSQGNLAALSEVRAWLCGHFPDRAGRSVFSRPGHRAGEGCNGTGKRVPRHLFCHDVLQHRSCLQLPQAVGRGHWQTGRRLRALPVRLHHLDRPWHFVDLLPWHAAAVGEVIYGNTENGSTASSRAFSEEIRKMEYEPLDSVEKKLIWYTFFSGVGLLDRAGSGQQDVHSLIASLRFKSLHPRPRSVGRGCKSRHSLESGHIEECLKVSD